LTLTTVINYDDRIIVWCTIANVPCGSCTSGPAAGNISMKSGAKQRHTTTKRGCITIQQELGFILFIWQQWQLAANYRLIGFAWQIGLKCIKLCSTCDEHGWNFTF